MRIPILPMTSDEDNEVLVGKVVFDVLTPKIRGATSKMVAVRTKDDVTSEDRGTVLVMDVKGLQRGNLNDVVLKRLRIRGMNTWFLTNIESVDDVFDAFNTDAECVLVPIHTVRSEDELSDILGVSDSVIPVLFVRKGSVRYIGTNIPYHRAAENVSMIGFPTIAVIDTDGSLSEYDWTSLMDLGTIIPCSFTGYVSTDRLEELGFEKVFTVPE